MGPNALRLLEELLCQLPSPLEPGMRVLDLGCGKGMTSLYLAKRFGLQVFAADLWIDPTENFKRFQAFDPELPLIPLRTEAHQLPFAEGYFDAIFCLDAYQYFGAKPEFLDTAIAPLLKPGGIFAIAVPGLKEEASQGIPEPLLPFWAYDEQGEDAMQFHAPSWWKDLWAASELMAVEGVTEMDCFDVAWQEWLVCDNPYAREDIAFIEADQGRYLNFVAAVAIRNSKPVPKDEKEQMF